MDKINNLEYKCAKVGARNEAPLLKSIYDHPECYSAKAMTGRDHKVIAVFDTVYGGKATVVEGVFNNSVLTNEESKTSDKKNMSKNNDDVS